MRFFFSQSIAVAALLAVVPSIVRADAMSDQKKAYNAMGITIPHPAAMCHLLTKAEVEHYLGTSVGDGQSAGADTGCAYRALADRNVGVLVLRHDRKDWSPPAGNSHYVSQFQPVSGIGEKAYTDYEVIGYAATVLARNGVTIVQLSGKGTAATALALARIAMNR